jgi:hypothetical protein
MSKKTGIGASLVFSGGITYTGFRIQSIGAIAEMVEALEDTALSSDGFYESCPDDLAKVDPFDAVVYADFTKQAPLASVGTITLNMPLQEGQTVPAKVIGSGYVSRRERPELAAGTRLTETVQVTFDGKTGPAFTPAS